ncbi:hypothetical protein PE36_17780 [Moritella sp. PE36]|uniref:hypothetical protein n=1 Tax=Moritella sp. PE36 TaxID=58051 RepID=UPI00015682CD|nr:hypothetical protein [Moritella sp. PE36]EDM67839.1 hypothetical protein PE36_17780 [Moritella sp. PE36]
MDLNQLIEFSWGAISGGVYYDALKTTLGAVFPRLEAFKDNDKKELFDASLLAVLETNEQIKEEISHMVQGISSIEVTQITTGNIEASGTVIVGNHNIIGSSK